MHVCVHRLNSQLKADLQLSQPVRFVPKADVEVNYLSGQVYAYRTKAGARPSFAGFGKTPIQPNLPFSASLKKVDTLWCTSGRPAQ